MDLISVALCSRNIRDESEGGEGDTVHKEAERVREGASGEGES